MLVIHGHPQAIPAFLTIAVMPMTYSIAYGVIAGLVSYIVINATNWLIDALRAGLKALPGFIKHTMMHKVLRCRHRSEVPVLVLEPGTASLFCHPRGFHLYAGSMLAVMSPFKDTTHYRTKSASSTVLHVTIRDVHTSHEACV